MCDELQSRCWVWTGALIRTKSGGYGAYRCRVHKKTKLVHRLTYITFSNPLLEPSAELDHICHNTECCNPEHLRETTHKQNKEHLKGAYSNSSSQVRGVTWAEHTKQWKVVVGHNYKTYRFGYFPDLVEAEAVAIICRSILFSHDTTRTIDVTTAYARLSKKGYKYVQKASALKLSLEEEENASI